MTVTETTVHKINGQPLYTWEQKRDGTWHTVPVTVAPHHLLDVVTDRDEFEFVYRAILPELTDSARMWLPMPATDAFQTVEVTAIKVPGNSAFWRSLCMATAYFFLNLARAQQPSRRDTFSRAAY